MTYSKSPSNQGPSGFTLIETLAVLLLLGILAATVRSVLLEQTIDLKKEGDLLTSHLRYTQLQAQTDIYHWQLVFTDSTNYQLGPVVLPGVGFTPQLVPGTGSAQGVLKNGVTAAAGTSIHFNSWGQPLNGNGTPSGTNQAITVSKGAKNFNLSILAETGLIQ